MLGDLQSFVKVGFVGLESVSNSADSLFGFPRLSWSGASYSSTVDPKGVSLGWLNLGGIAHVPDP